MAWFSSLLHLIERLGAFALSLFISFTFFRSLSLFLIHSLNTITRLQASIVIFSKALFLIFIITMFHNIILPFSLSLSLSLSISLYLAVSHTSLLSVTLSKQLVLIIFSYLLHSLSLSLSLLSHKVSDSLSPFLIFITPALIISKLSRSHSQSNLCLNCFHVFAIFLAVFFSLSLLLLLPLSPSCFCKRTHTRTHPCACTHTHPHTRTHTLSLSLPPFSNPVLFAATKLAFIRRPRKANKNRIVADKFFFSLNFQFS